MPPLSLILVAYSIIALDVASAYTAPAHTDTCSDQTAQLEALLSQWMGNPVAKLTVPQTVDAQLPTNTGLSAAGREKCHIGICVDLGACQNAERGWKDD